jgi:hypothetical protein
MSEISHFLKHHLTYTPFREVALILTSGKYPFIVTTGIISVGSNVTCSSLKVKLERAASEAVGPVSIKRKTKFKQSGKSCTVQRVAGRDYYHDL